MHRTTIYLDEAIYRHVKTLAQQRGKSLARTIELLLRRSLSKPATNAAPPILPLHHNNGPQPGINIADRDRLYDILDNH